MIPTELKFHHRYLVNGEMTPGDWDQSALEALLQPYAPLFQKKTCFDVGTLDGKWAFWAEDQGASEVVTCDPLPQPTFEWARAERFQCGVYQYRYALEEIAGVVVAFDHIIDFGVYYHVHDIVGHFQAIKTLLVQSPDSRVFVEGEVALGYDGYPYPPQVVEFYAHGYNNGTVLDPTTFWVPSLPALTDICQLAGFTVERPFEVYAQTSTDCRRHGRAFGILKHKE